MKLQKTVPRRAVLVALARRERIVDHHRAVGRCLVASLEIAVAAARRGIAVSLVRWTVRDDADFVDHWAVQLDARHVVDPTRVQVDASVRLVVEIDDYPANYVDRRVYPAMLFLADYVACPRPARATLPAAFMLSMARAMFRFDTMTAVRASFPVRVLGLAADLAGVHLRVLKAAVAVRLQARRRELERRLAQAARRPRVIDRPPR